MSRAKRQIFVAHRRGRKTSETLAKVFQYLWANPGIVGKTLAPQRKQAKEIIWDDPDMLFNGRICPQDIIAHVDKSALKITLTNGSIWTLDGADNPQKKRGSNVKVLHLTEAGDHEEVIWQQIYEPILIANGGVALFEGNPRGRNWYFRLFESAEHRRGWERFLLSAEDSPIFTAAELEDLRRNTPDAVFRSEYLCEWVDSLGTVFRGFEELATATERPAEWGKQYRIGVDLAKNQDYTVVTVVDRHTWEEVKIDRFNHLSWPVIKERIKQTVKEYSRKDDAHKNAVELVVESVGVGDPIFDDLWEWTGKPDVSRDYEITLKPFNTTNAAKALLVSNLSMLFDEKLIRIIPMHEAMQELAEFTYRKTAQHFIYSHPQGGHDDTVMSKMMAYWDLGTKLPVPEQQTEEKYQWGFKQSELKKMQERQAALARLQSLM